MLKWFKPKQRTMLGIDISSSSVKAVEISAVGERYCVEGYGALPLPSTAVEGSSIKDTEAVASCIRQLLTTRRLNCKKAAIAVPDSLAISRVIQVNDGLSEDEIEELVVIEADKYIPYPIDEINLDFNIIGTSVKNTAMLDVLIVASRAENVSYRVEAVTKSGLEAAIVDVESYAIERVAQCLASDLPAKGENKIIAIVDVGAEFTHFFIMHGLKIIFTREEEFGGKQLVESLAKYYGMTTEEASEALNNHALPEDAEASVLQPFKEQILLQVKRGLQFFFSSSQHTYVDYIMLAGGVAKLPEIDQLLQEHTNIPTGVANPFKHMDVSKEVERSKIDEDSPGLLVACGLALRAAAKVN